MFHFLLFIFSFHSEIRALSSETRHAVHAICSGATPDLKGPSTMTPSAVIGLVNYFKHNPVVKYNIETMITKA